MRRFIICSILLVGGSLHAIAAGTGVTVYRSMGAALLLGITGLMLVRKHERT